MSALTEASGPATTTRDLPAPGLDWALLVSALLLSGLGLLMILSASSLMADARYGDALHFVVRQSLGLTFGALGAVALASIPWRVTARWAGTAYILCLVGLVLVFSPLGHEANGAARWLRFGGLNVQPSQYAQVALVLVLGRFLAANEGRLRDPAVVFTALGIASPALVMVFFQPDFGSLVVQVGLVGLLLAVAGLQKRWIAGLGGAALAALALLVVVEPYRIRRLVSFMDPLADPSGAGYQVLQGWIALASGGWAGQGLATGVAQRGFLPEAHTDFISAVVGEELGAVGWLAMVVLYMVMAWRGTVIASRARDLYGMLVAIGLTSLLAAQAVVNLGVVVGWLPAKGLVLPFMSYGASAVVAHALCVGLLLRIGMESHGSGVGAQQVARPAGGT